MRIRNLAMGAALAALALGAPQALAAQAVIKGEIRRTLAVPDARWGGCMALLSKSPADEGLDCPTSRWVTFSCSGVHAKKSDAQRVFDSAQLAFVSRREAFVWVDDTKKHNGFCFANRVDVVVPRD